MKITFIGATHEVTGSCTLLENGGKYYLVDKGYRDYFKRVVFAIKGGGRNYEVFRDILTA